MMETRTIACAIASAVVLSCSSGGDDGSGRPELMSGGPPPTNDDPGAQQLGGGDTSGGFSVNVSSGSVCGGENANVLFVVDRSGSMNCNLPPITDSVACEQNPVHADTGQPRKWDIIRGTMSNAFDSLIPEAGGIAIRAGLAYFSRDDICGVVSAPAVPVVDVTQGHADALRGSLQNEVPKGGTPIVGATILAYKHLHQDLALDGTGNVILVTDGADSCGGSYDALIGPGDYVRQLIDVEMPKALQANIRTFVIGAPGSENARSVLSQMAVAGGTAPEGCNTGASPTEGDCHYDMTLGDFQAKFTEALSEITKIVTCRVE